MEVAGQAVAAWARERFLGGDARGKAVLVLAGSGGNGGDGMVAARFLHSWGGQPAVWLSHDAATLHGQSAAAHQLRSLRALGLSIHPPDQDEPAAFPDADLIVDALLGFGLSGPPSGPAARLITAANAHPVPVLAVDLPSGLDASTGLPYDPCIRADATLTLALPKTGLLAAAARPVTGELAVADIGVPPQVYARLGVHVEPLFGQQSIVRVMGSEGDRVIG
jgi:NAD(P)H-hydrate epimerase